MFHDFIVGCLCVSKNISKREPKMTTIGNAISKTHLESQTFVNLTIEVLIQQTWSTKQCSASVTNYWHATSSSRDVSQFCPVCVLPPKDSSFCSNANQRFQIGQTFICFHLDNADCRCVRLRKDEIVIVHNGHKLMQERRWRLPSLSNRT